MKQYCIHLLRRLLLWLDPPVEKDLTAPMARVKALVEQVDALDASGEAKRHQVYARLIKDFPEQRRRDLAFAIEQIMQERD